METHGTGETVTPGFEPGASQVIQSVELKGSRVDRLKALDALIAQLVSLRRDLAGDVTAVGHSYEGPSRYADAPAWPWFAAGALCGVLLVVVPLLVRSCA